MATGMWAMQGGTSTFGVLNAVAMGIDGSSVCAGYTIGGPGGSSPLGTRWAATKLDVDGTVEWTWENGFPCCEDYRIEAAIMDEDGSVMLAGSGRRDFHCVKLDADGSLLWHFEDGSNGADVATGIAVGADGSVVVAGETDGDWDIPNLGNGDMAAYKLDADGTLLWRWQGETDKSDSASVVVIADDGSVVIAGVSGGEFIGVNSSVSTSSDLWVMTVIKLDARGAEDWRWQDVPDNGYPGVHAMSVTEDGSVVIASNVGSPRGENQVDAVKLDADGKVVGRWQNGHSEDENFLAVVVQADGTVVLGGRTKRKWPGSNAGFHYCTVEAVGADGEAIWRWQVTRPGWSEDVAKASGYDVIDAMAEGCDGRIALAGKTFGLWVDINIGQGQCVVVTLDTGALVTSLQYGTHTTSARTTPDPAASNATPSTPRVRSSQFGPAELVATPAVGAATPAPLSTRFLQVETVVPSPTPPAPTAAAAEVETVVPSPTPPAPTAAAAEVETVVPSPTPPAPTAAAAEVETVVPSPIPPAPTAAAAAPFAASFPTLAPASSTPAPSATLAPGSVLPTEFMPPPTTSPFSEGSAIAPSGSFVSSGSTATASSSYTTPAPSGDPTPSSPQGGADSTIIFAGVASAVAVFTVLARIVFVRKQHIVNKNKSSRQGHIAVVVDDEGSIPPPLHQHMHPPPEHLSTMIAEETTGRVGGSDQSLPDYFAGGAQPAAEPATRERNGGDGGGDGAIVAIVKGGTRPAFHDDKDGGGEGGGDGALIAGKYAEDGSATPALTVSTTTTKTLTGERNEFAAALGENGASSSTDPRSSFGGLRLGQAVGDAAEDLARNCSIPGVSEAATALSILVGLMTNNRDNKNGIEASLRRCRSIVLMLQRAAKVLGKGGDTAGKAERAMMEDVHDAIFDLVELVKTYQSKNKLSQLLMSTLFRRRQDEMGAVVDRAILGLQYGNDISALKQHVGAFQQDAGTMKHTMHPDQNSIEEALSKSLAEARTARRQRKLNQIEIPEEHVAITDELLGKGGFGEVFLADYNGRNAAVKVMHISHEIGRSGENEVLDGSVALYLKRQRMKDQRKAFLRELDAMIRLRSPYTVNVYGSVTSMSDRLVLVMELLSGGDLRTLLGNCDHPLSEQQSRHIIGDICAGMEFLHSKETVHGDLKSANVLLDGAGRAKIGDFGTSRWTQHTMSTGLATFTTKFSQNTQMSLAWSAPEVLDEPGSTYASDVYSFAIVVWEVLSRELPWATESHPRNIYIRVALKGQRPVIPDDAPTEIANIAKVCWAKEPGDRPTFSAVLKQMKSSGWNE